MIRLVLVDDHDIVRAGIKRLLENNQNIKVVGDFGNGETAYEFIRENKVDVIVMDLSMPGKGGIESTRQIKKQFPKINILPFFFEVFKKMSLTWASLPTISLLGLIRLEKSAK